VRWLGFGLLLLVASVVIAAEVAERFVNTLDPVPLPEISARARALHDATFVVDLHADSLLFGRDLLSRSSVGHVDVPRLREGGVALQVFDAVTVAPLGMNIGRTETDGADMLDALDAGQLAPGRIGKPLARALVQAERMAKLVAASNGELRLVRTRADLDALVARRREDPKVVGAILGIEGAHALAGGVANLAALELAGYRIVGLAHFFDNEFAGSAHGERKSGLTEKGRALVRALDARKLLIDLAHASPRAFDEALALSARPVLVSHTGVRATCDNPRNLSDAQLRAVAKSGGVVGIGYWGTAVCGRTPAKVAAAIRHAVKVAGEDHVALGSDFDGATKMGFDVSQLRAVTQALVDVGLSDAQIRKVLGENALKLFSATLP
jgi:microsomal dipeptidase-like Zn-dependent dipeptidase